MEVKFSNFDMVDRSQFKDLHEPSNDNFSKADVVRMRGVSHRFEFVQAARVAWADSAEKFHKQMAMDKFCVVK